MSRGLKWIPNEVKRRVAIVAVVAGLLIVVLSGVYQLAVEQSPLTVTFVGYTNFVAGRMPFAVFAVTNISARPVRCWVHEAHLVTGRAEMGSMGPIMLEPGQGTRLEVTSVGAWPIWRVAVLSTGTVKEKWNRLLTATSYVASNQWDQLQFDRSFSPWIAGPPSIPAPPAATP